MDGQSFTALIGGPIFKFNEAISFQIECDMQEEVDRFWDKLGAGGDPAAQQCGWLMDKFGLSWQVVPKGMAEMFKDHKSEGAWRAFKAMMGMRKLGLAALQHAFEEPR